MTTDCNPQQLEFQGVGRRMLVASFDGGTLTSDGGVLLLGEVDRRRGLLDRFAACFTDHRNPAYVEHSLAELLRQRVFALALAYEDLNDHDELRRDPLLAAVVGKADPTGRDRRHEQDRGKPLAGKSTLNRLEWGAVKQDRYRKITVDDDAVDRFFVDVFLSGQPEARLQRSFWIWTPRMILCMASRKAAFSTAITAATAICRCTSFAAPTCFVPACGGLMRMPPRERSARWSASWLRSARVGRRCASSCEAIRGLPVKS